MTEEVNSMSDIRIPLAMSVIIAALIGAVIALSLHGTSAPTKGYGHSSYSRSYSAPAKAGAPKCSLDGNYANDAPGCVK